MASWEQKLRIADLKAIEQIELEAAFGPKKAQLKKSQVAPGDYSKLATVTALVISLATQRVVALYLLRPSYGFTY
jgi:hypothetical protein